MDEPHVVGKPMNALPIDGILIVESIYHFLDFIQINLSVSNQVFRIYLLVAENAIFDRGHCGCGPLCYVPVAELALYTRASFFHCPCVYCMGEGYWLWRGVS